MEVAFLCSGSASIDSGRFIFKAYDCVCRNEEVSLCELLLACKVGAEGEGVAPARELLLRIVRVGEGSVAVDTDSAKGDFSEIEADKT